MSKISVKDAQRLVSQKAMVAEEDDEDEGSGMCWHNSILRQWFTIEHIFSIDHDEIEENPCTVPQGFIKLRPSEFNEDIFPPTIFFDYPKELNMFRDDKNRLEPSTSRKLRYNSYWERICIRNAFYRAGFEKNEKNWTVLWSKHRKNSDFKSFNCLQKVNHFPASWCLGRKDRLCKTIATMRRLHGIKEYSFHPETFILPYDKDGLARQVTSMAIVSVVRFGCALWHFIKTTT